MSQPPPARCGFIAIVGAPNAGKSTLMNRLTGAKLSIVSPKAQTTRFRVLGILMRAESQVLLVDTPGIFRPKRKLDRAMVAAAWSGAADADLAILLVDAKSGLREDVREIAERLGASGRRCWLVLNKTDLMSPPALLPLIASLGALANFEETFMVSAQTGDGVRRLADALAVAVPVGPWLFPEDDLTDLPDRLLAAETVREQIFMQTHEEVPYGATVETEILQGTQGRLRQDRNNDLRRPLRPQGDFDRRQRQQDQSDRGPSPAGPQQPAGSTGPPVPQRQGTQGLG